MVKTGTDGGSIISEEKNRLHKHDDHPDINEEYNVKSIQDNPTLHELKTLLEKSKKYTKKKIDKFTVSEHEKLYNYIIGALKEIIRDVNIMLNKIDVKNMIDYEDNIGLNNQIENVKELNAIFKKIYKKYNTDNTDHTDNTDTNDNGTDNIIVCDVEINKIKQIIEDSKDIRNYFIERNEEFVANDNNEKYMNIEYEKDFKIHLQTKINILDEKLIVLQMKYNTYKRWYDRFNILIIIMSSSLSIFEALRIQIDEKIVEDTAFYYFFSMVPISISSTITCTAAIIKFKKYQEKMENMQFAREKLILAINKLQEVKESLWFNERHEFKIIKKKYVNDIFKIYNEGVCEIDRHVKQDDYDKFHKKYIEPKEKEKEKEKIDEWKVL